MAADLQKRSKASPGARYSEAPRDIRGRTEHILACIDDVLHTAGSDKTHILMAQVFLVNMDDVDGMNRAWGAWVAQGNAPCRATVHARLARPEWRIAIVVTAASRQ